MMLVTPSTDEGPVEQACWWTWLRAAATAAGFATFFAHLLLVRHVAATSSARRVAADRRVKF